VGDASAIRELIDAVKAALASMQQEIIDREVSEGVKS
jgi:DNA-binding FrmR family transcriptional regulator